MRLAESYSRATIVKTFEQDNKPYATIKEPCDRCGGSGIFFVAVLNGHGVPAQPDGGTCYKCHGAGTIVKDVRMYTDAEYERMQKAKQAAADKKKREWDAQAEERLASKNLATLQRYGFQELDAYAVLGNTFDIKDQLKEAESRFSPELHWVCPTEPTWLTEHSYVKINVADVLTINEYGAFELRDDAADFISSFEPTIGEHIGQVSQRISVDATLVRSIPYTSQFGSGMTYIFETKEKNTLVWRTTSAYLDDGTEYHITGTVKEHSEYNHVRQTVLTRCKTN